MANRIQLRRDTATNWQSVNPILSDGEPGLDITTNKVKYGDGSTAWNDLSYASGGLTFDANDMLQLSGNLWVGTWKDGDSVLWADNTAEYVGLWYGGDRDPEGAGNPNVSITVGNVSLEDPGLRTDWDDGLQINFDIADKNWHFDAAGTTTFPDNTITPVTGNDLAVNTAIEYQVSSLNFGGSNNSYVLFNGFTVGPSRFDSFTIEFFFRLADDPSSIQHAFIGAGYPGGLSIYTGAGVGTPNNTTITVDCSDNSNQQFTVPTLDSSWHHLILVRKGATPGPFPIGAMAMWYDGVRVGAFNDTTSFDGVTNAIGMWDATNMHLVGSIAGLRITNTAEYDVNVETYPIPRYVAPLVTGTRLLLRVQDAGDNAYIDSSPNHYILTPGSDVGSGGLVDVPQTGGTHLSVEIDKKWNFGADGSLTLPNGAMIVSNPVRPIITGNTSVTYYNYDASNLTVYCQVGDTVDFPNFSGQILLNSYNTGQVELWLCGSGSGGTYLLGTSKDNFTPDNLGNIDVNGMIGGYTWTCAIEGDYVFVATRTRSGA